MRKPGRAQQALRLLVLAAGLCVAATGRAQTDEQLRAAAASVNANRVPGVVPPVSNPANPVPPLAGPVDPQTYRLGPNDVLSLEYSGRVTDTKVLTVDGEGRLRIPDLGLVPVGGRTLADARSEILRRLKPFVPGATVDLRLIQPRTFKVFVIGEVKEPGTQQVTGSARVSEAIDAAGGINPGGSGRNVQVLHLGGGSSLVDIERFRHDGNWAGNPYLEDGDRIIVPVLTRQIGVFGAVARPGFYEFRDGDSLSTGLVMAGGLLPEARLDSVFIVRFQGIRTLDTLYTNLPDPRGSVPILLQADDRIFIRSQSEWRPKQQVTVTGEVRSPGGYAINEGKDRVSDLLRWAGGFTEHAATVNVRLDRSLPEGTTDVEFDRLNRLPRSEMTNTEYQTYRSKLTLRQATYLIDFSRGLPIPVEKNVLLRNGDRIDVPRLELAVRVDGSVRSPGLVAFEEGLRVDDYLKMAGGLANRANYHDTRLTRAGSTNTLFARDVRRVEPGDFIWVPEKKDVSFWTVFRDVIIVGGQVATIVLAVDQLSRR